MRLPAVPGLAPRAPPSSGASRASPKPTDSPADLRAPLHHHAAITSHDDAGGHDEYQEMQQVFVTPGALYFLLWNVAKRPAEGQDEMAFERETVAEQVGWAQIIQSCAPGSWGAGDARTS